MKAEATENTPKRRGRRLSAGTEPIMFKASPELKAFLASKAEEDFRDLSNFILMLSYRWAKENGFEG